VSAGQVKKLWIDFDEIWDNYYQSDRSYTMLHKLHDDNNVKFAIHLLFQMEMQPVLIILLLNCNSFKINI